MTLLYLHAQQKILLISFCSHYELPETFWYKLPQNYW